jgi:hypothetical protein
MQTVSEPLRNVWDFSIIADLDTQSKYVACHLSTLATIPASPYPAPLSLPWSIFRVADSKKPSFYSILIDGVLMKDPASGKFSVQWGAEHKLTSAHNEAGRGMELSELVKYNGCAIHPYYLPLTS